MERMLPGDGSNGDGQLAREVRALDSVSRALLDLTVRRGYSGAEIADLLDMPPAETEQMREEAFGHLAERLGVDTEAGRGQIERGLGALGEEVWLGTDQEMNQDRVEPGSWGHDDDDIWFDDSPAQSVEPDDVEDPEPPGAPAEDLETARAPTEASETASAAPVAAPGVPAPSRTRPEPKPAGEVSRRTRAAGFVSLLAAAIAAGAIAWTLTSSDDSSTNPRAIEPSSSEAPVPSASEAPAPSPTTATAAATPIPGFDTQGKVSVIRDGQDFRIRLRGLPDPRRGVFTAWLYNSVIDSKRLGALGAGDGTINAPLPNDAQTYDFLDISRESSAGDSTHSGRSVFRVPLGPLVG